MKSRDNRQAPTGSTGEAVSAGIDMALTVSRDGAVFSVLRAPESANADELAGKDMSALWPESIVNRVLQLIRGTLRSRDFHFESLTAEGRELEFTLVAQGRDRVLMLVRDVSERALVLNNIQRLAYIDDATKLPNRKFLRKELDTILENVRLTEGRVALLYFDVDSIASRSMFYNPQRQEVVVREVAERLRNELRGVNDSLPIDYERYTAAARIDFSQFAVVLPGVDTGAAAEAVARRLIEALGQPIAYNDRSIRVSISAGIAITPQDGTDSDSLMEKAAAAMDVARGSQSEDCKFYSGTAKLPALQRKDMELELQSALDRQEFALNYLPILCAGSGRVKSIEALLRWPRNLFEARSITQIVSLAEHTGLIQPIGEWVMRRACEEIQALHAVGHDSLKLAVNLSMQEFARPDLVEYIAAMLDEHQLAPSALQLEITEHLVFRDAMCEYPVSKSLRELGVGITVDDYGTGACSLAHLAHSPATALKIDNSIVMNSGDNPMDRSACLAACAMARELGVTVIAEGVETEEQAELLREAGCSQLQGFLFGQPLRGDELGLLLAGNSKKKAGAQ